MTSSYCSTVWMSYGLQDQSSTGGHLCCFHSFVITNNATMNPCTCIILHICGTYVGIHGHIPHIRSGMSSGQLTCTLVDNARWPPWGLGLLYTPISSRCCSVCSLTTQEWCHTFPSLPSERLKLHLSVGFTLNFPYSA